MGALSTAWIAADAALVAEIAELDAYIATFGDLANDPAGAALPSTVNDASYKLQLAVTAQAGARASLAALRCNGGRTGRKLATLDL